jgi:hypothetical protein|tara:strand:- start:105 stop:323 length:219 start_codon:yes stop_codon:yes gene_type:complete
VENYDEKIKSLDYRINNINKQISDLEQTKINLMMIKREINLDYTKQKLEDAFTDELRDEFKKDKYKDFDKWN